MKKMMLKTARHYITRKNDIIILSFFCNKKPVLGKLSKEWICTGQVQQYLTKSDFKWVYGFIPKKNSCNEFFIERMNNVTTFNF
jgi:hypothetical protein